MQCPACGSEDVNIEQTLRNTTIERKFNVHCDTRVHICNNCCLIFPVECRVEYVYVFDKETMKKKLVRLDVFIKHYRDALGATVKDLKLYD